MLGSSIQIAGGGGLLISSPDVGDDVLFELGADSDQVLLNRSTTLTADTALTGVLIGTPDTPALAANSLIIANATANGDILIAGNDGGHSRTALFFDSSVGNVYLGKPGTPGNATASGDVYVAGKFEVDGELYADGGCTVVGASYFSSHLYVGATTVDGAIILGGSAAAPFRIFSNNDDADAINLMFTSSNSGNFSPLFVFGDVGCIGLDLGGAGMDYSSRVEPITAVIDNDNDSSVHFGFASDDYAEINGKGNFSGITLVGAMTTYEAHTGADT